MKNILKLLPIKIILIFIGTIFGAWLLRSVFAQLFIYIIKPDSFTGLIMYQTQHYLEGFLIAYSFLVSLLNFLFIYRKNWISLLILLLPLLLFSLIVGLLTMFIWYAVMLIIGWLLAHGVLLIHRKVKK
jgi:hypothetical protein